ILPGQRSGWLLCRSRSLARPLSSTRCSQDTNCKAMRILICSNGMPAGDQAARLGGLIARRCKAETTLLGIAERPGDEDDLRKALEMTNKALQSEGVASRIVV